MYKFQFEKRNKPTARHRTLTKHNAGLHTAMQVGWQAGWLAGYTACLRESESTRIREYKQSRGQEHRIGINLLYAKNDNRIALFANEFRKGGSILITISIPSLVCFLSSSAKVVQTVFES